MTDKPKRLYLRTSTLLGASSIGTVLGMGLMMWALFDGGPLAVIGFMSIGQGIGTLSLGLFLIAIVRDVLRARAIVREARARGVSTDSGENAIP